MTQHKIDVTPDKSLIKKLGSVGYRTEQAIAELIDNSIDARLDGTLETIRIVLDFANRTISVRDDGAGMDLGALRNSWVLGAHSKSSNSSLGMFGIGMKSACSALGKSFSVRTTTAGSTAELYAKYDEDEWLGSSGGWDDFEVTETPADADTHGTEVVVSKINVALYRAQAAQFRKRFGTRYAQHMLDQQIKITVNNKPCRPIEPDIDYKTKKNLDISLSDGNRIHGWIALLRQYSVKGDYGFNLYQNSRLISSHAKFGIRYHPAVSRVVGNLHLDHVPVNVLKTGFLPDTYEYAQSFKAIENDPTVKKLINESEPHEKFSSDYASVFRNDVPPTKIPRIGDVNASRLLRNMISVDVLDTASPRMALEDCDTGVYRIEGSGDETKVIVNRQSAVFRAFKNPLFLLGMLRLEAQTLSGHSEAQRLITKRNKTWEQFVDSHSINRDIKRIGSNDTLPNNLVKLRSSIMGEFSERFQFTALSILWPHLINAYRILPYTVYVARGYGQLLKHVVSQQSGYHAILNPDPGQVHQILEARDGGALVIIRERSDVPKLTAASYAKAWVDLFVEIRHERVGVYEEELEMLWDLEDHSLLTMNQVLSYAKRRSVAQEVAKYTGDDTT